MHCESKIYGPLADLKSRKLNPHYIPIAFTGKAGFLSDALSLCSIPTGHKEK